MKNRRSKPKTNSNCKINHPMLEVHTSVNTSKEKGSPEHWKKAIIRQGYYMVQKITEVFSSNCLSKTQSGYNMRKRKTPEPSEGQSISKGQSSSPGLEPETSQKPVRKRKKQTGTDQQYGLWRWMQKESKKQQAKKLKTQEVETTIDFNLAQKPLDSLRPDSTEVGQSNPKIRRLHVEKYTFYFEDTETMFTIFVNAVPRAEVGTFPTTQLASFPSVDNVVRSNEKSVLVLFKPSTNSSKLKVTAVDRMSEKMLKKYEGSSKILRYLYCNLSPEQRSAIDNFQCPQFFKTFESYLETNGDLIHLYGQSKCILTCAICAHKNKRILRDIKNQGFHKFACLQKLRMHYERYHSKMVPCLACGKKFGNMKERRGHFASRTFRSDPAHLAQKAAEKQKKIEEEIENKRKRKARQARKQEMLKKSLKKSKLG